MSRPCPLCGTPGVYEYAYPALGDDPEVLAVADAIGATVGSEWLAKGRAIRAITALDAFRGTGEPQ